MRKYTLENKYYRCCGSINFKELSNNDDEIIKLKRLSILKKIVNAIEDYDYTLRYYVIPHDDTETWHIHYLIVLRSQVRLSTVLNYLSSTLDLNPASINIQPNDTLTGHIKYFCHLTKSSIDDGKKVYSANDIISNDSFEVVDSYVNSKTGQLDSYAFIEIVCNCKDYMDLMNTFGLSIFHKYRYEIEKIFEQKGYYLARINENKRADEETPF